MSEIAVVEDNADNRLLLSIILGEQYQIAEFETGYDALEAFANDVPQLVLLDIALPGIDGVEVIRRMRRDPALQQVPVVALTAHAMYGDRERYLAAGFDEYVSKPIEDQDALIALVERLLASSVARRA
jgi:CheY-like chemotaxis protein